MTTTSTPSTICRIATDSYQPSTCQACRFLSEYAVVLFGSGATCIRIEKNVQRIAQSLGMDSQFSILPRHIHISVSSSPTDTNTQVAAIEDMPISFEKITLLSRLSWDMADRLVDFNQATSILNDIKSSKGIGRWPLLFLVSLANASFCRLFGGDFLAMGIVFLATFAGFFMKQKLTSHHVDFRITVFICAFISAVLAAGDSLFGVSSTPDVAIGTSVLYLVPGIPFINSFCDMIDRHYLCAFGRLMNAIVICACLSLGLCFAMLLMGVGMF